MRTERRLLMSKLGVESLPKARVILGAYEIAEWMEEYRQQTGVTDEEIEEWIHNDAHWAKTFINGAIYGAKAHRDKLIPKR